MMIRTLIFTLLMLFLTNACTRHSDSGSGNNKITTQPTVDASRVIATESPAAKSEDEAAKAKRKNLPTPSEKHMESQTAPPTEAIKY